MKKLIALIAVLGFASYAQAADGVEFSQSGDFRVQYQHDVNPSFQSGLGGSEFIHQRLRWGANWRVGEKMSAHLSMVDNANWGENPDQTPAGRASTTTGTTTNIATVQEAYGTWMATDSVVLKFGRQSLTLGDGRWISANDYENVNTAVDALTAKWENETLRVIGAAARASNATTTGAVASGNNVGRYYGANVDWKSAPDFLKTVSAHYALVGVDSADYTGTALDPIPSQDAARDGVAVAGDKMGLDYRVNYEMWTGKRTSGTHEQDIDSNMMDAEVGYTLPSLMGLRVHATYHTDSGTSSSDTKDKTYQGFYYDRRENGGLMQMFAWGNLTYTKFGLAASPRDDLSVAANYYMFSKTEASDQTYNGSGRIAGKYLGNWTNVVGNKVTAAAPSNGDKDLGSELDIVVTKKYTNNFSINAHYSTFSPGAVIKANAGSTAETEYYLESKLTF